MINPEIIFGRLGNKMFQYATLYAKARDEGRDFFFQDPKYFDKYRGELKTLFGSGIGYIPRTAIHVRRANNPINPDEPKYSENPYYVSLTDTDYYERAIAMFPNENFAVFSDDPEWCKQKWGNDERFQILDKGDEVEDLNLMASCKNIIMANSSYSWWAAYLNPNHPKVIAPRAWYSDGIQRTICPKEWVMI